MTRRTGSSCVIVLLAAGWIIALAAVSVSAQTLIVSPVGSIPGPADMVRVQGEYAYVADGRTLTVFDISSPAAPMRQGAYAFPEEIWSFRVAGAFAYVGVNFFGLGILDVSNAAAPTLRGSFKTPGQAKTGAVSGTKALVVDHMEGILLLDVSNPAAPVSLGSFFLDGYARDVGLDGVRGGLADGALCVRPVDAGPARARERASFGHCASERRGRGSIRGRESEPRVPSGWRVASSVRRVRSRGAGRSDDVSSARWGPTGVGQRNTGLRGRGPGRPPGRGSLNALDASPCRRVPDGKPGA